MVLIFKKHLLFAKMNSVRVLLSLVVNLDWPLLQFEVKTAFLNRDLEEEVYMDLPLIFYSDHGKVCRLRKSLYRLKQSLRAWFCRFMKAIQHHGFIQA